MVTLFKALYYMNMHSLSYFLPHQHLANVLLKKLVILSFLISSLELLNSNQNHHLFIIHLVH
jgi:hypothetical protein